MPLGHGVAQGVVTGWQKCGGCCQASKTHMLCRGSVGSSGSSSCSMHVWAVWAMPISHSWQSVHFCHSQHPMSQVLQVSHADVEKTVALSACPACLSSLLLQASCGFCQPPAVSTLASGSSSSQTGLLLDECQDDMNVCPFLASSGLCSSGSMWVETQCARSCGQCSTGSGGMAGEHCAESMPQAALHATMVGHMLTQERMVQGGARGAARAQQLQGPRACERRTGPAEGGERVGQGC